MRALIAVLIVAGCGAPQPGHEPTPSNLAREGGRSSATDGSKEPCTLPPPDGTPPPRRAKAVAAGDAFSCALTVDGGVYCWGSNAHHQLGRPTKEPWRSGVPGRVPRLNDVTSIAAGSDHACAVSGGAVFCWGRNQHGQLGDGTDAERAHPVRVIGLDDVVEIAAADRHTCARRANGIVSCWGESYHGEVGPGAPFGPSKTRGSRDAHGGMHPAPERSLTPVRVTGLSSAVELALGDNSSCARSAHGPWHCWGELGDPAVTRSPRAVQQLPSPPPKPPPQITGMSRGKMHSCGLRDEYVYCWGYNEDGCLGDGTRWWRTSPTRTVVDSSGARGTSVRRIETGNGRSCAIRNDGSVSCWGYNGNDQGLVGRDGRFLGGAPKTITGGLSATQVVMGASHSCALQTNGSVRCWGDNRLGQLGDGTRKRRARPAPVSGLDDAVHLAAGWNHTCAVRSDNSLWCWGANERGELGDGTHRRRLVPARNKRVTNTARVYAANGRTCALSHAGELECFGDRPPTKLPGVKSVAMGRVTCALMTAGGVRCTREDAPGWRDVTDSVGTKAIAAGSGHACLLDAEGRVRCFGRNQRGQLGRGTMSPKGPLDDVARLCGVVGISVHGDHSCALTKAGSVWCWGDNERLQLADGSTIKRETPSIVVWR